MPPLSSEFAKQVDRALSLAQAGETIRAASPKGSVAWDELRPARLEALYEMAYLRVFVEWEVFLEESFVRYLSGYATSTGPAQLLNPPCRTLNDSRTAMLGGRDFVTWANPVAVERLCRSFINNGAHELVVRSNRNRLTWFASVRHRVAHGSAHAKREFDIATMGLAGRRYRGSSPGSFLRDWTPGVSPPERWLQSIGTEFKNLAFQIIP